MEHNEMEEHTKKNKNHENLQNINPNNEENITNEVLQPRKRKRFEESCNLTQEQKNFKIKKPRNQNTNKRIGDSPAKDKLKSSSLSSSSSGTIKKNITNTIKKPTSTIESPLLDKKNKITKNEIKNTKVSAPSPSTSTNNIGIVDDAIDGSISADINTPNTSSNIINNNNRRVSGVVIQKVEQKSTGEIKYTNDYSQLIPVTTFASLPDNQQHQQQQQSVDNVGVNTETVNIILKTRAGVEVVAIPKNIIIRK